MDYEKLIAIIENESVGARDRFKASINLSKIGDHRPGIGVDDKGTPQFVWSDPINAGSLFIGSAEDEDFAFDNEKPKHKVTHNEFCISKYPVTNAQFKAFVDSKNGWDSDKWWTIEGAKWRRDSKKWKQGDYPDNYPCINLNWYSAVAYSNWVSSLMAPDITIRLPTEPEWERAARGIDDRKYPWGDEFDSNKCNVQETGINDLSIVGMFPGGKSPYGALDMVGGTWEWCLSLSLPYPYDSDREDVNREGKRVIRGGAYNQDPLGVRCAMRREDPPGYFGNRISFRLVRISTSK